MFGSCDSLTDIRLGEFNTANAVDMSGMFSGCYELTGIDVSSFKTDKVTSMRHMFSNCLKLAKLDIRNFNTGKVTDMSDMFLNCWKLTALELGKLNTTAVTNMSGMFSGCSKLTTLNVSSFNTTAVTNMSGMFSGCSKLTTLNVSSFNTTKVTDTSNMFSSCSSLEAIDLKSFDLSNVTNAKDMFSSCTNLRTFDVSSLKLGKVVDVSGMFMSCEELTSVGLSGLNTAKVTDMSSMFRNCGKLTSLDLSGFDMTNVTKADDMLLNMSDLTVISAPRNVSISVALPLSQKWCKPDKTIVEELPKGLKSSIKLTKQLIVEPRLSVQKDKTTYWCGESLDISDLKVTYTDSYGQVSQPADFSTNKAKIDMSTAGTKKLIVTYKGLTASIDIVVKKPSVESGITWDIDADGKLTVTGSGDYKSGFWSSAPWYQKHESIKTAVVSVQGITDMSGMFKDCENLTSIDFSGSDTSNVTNMSQMFYQCGSLVKLDLSGFDTGNVKNMNFMFEGCSSLTVLDLSRFDTRNVTSMTSMFRGCSSLTELNLSSFDTGKAERMNYMFEGCSSLTVLDLSRFDTRNVTDLSFMFYRCSSLAKLELSGFNTEKVKSVEYMFRGCSSLTELDVSRFDTGNVTTMSGMFYNCSNLAELDVSRFDTGNVTDMSDMFRGCSSLTELDVSRFNTGNVTTMSDMFYDCSNLTELNLSSFNTGNVTDMSGMFIECSSLRELNLSGFDTGNVTDLSFMFSRCSNLSKLNLSGFDTGNVTDMNYMFNRCSNLSKLNLSGFDTGNVTSMSSMFDCCSNLTELDLSGFNTGNVTDMNYMFNRCKGLTGLDLSSFDLSSCTGMKDTIKGCINLQTIRTPRNLTGTVSLPSKDWHDAQGNQYEALPTNKNESVLLEREVKPLVDPYITAVKTKVLYEYGETINTDDLKVMYYDELGASRQLGSGEYTTNVKQIDIFKPGKVMLTVTYGKLTANVILTISEEENSSTEEGSTEEESSSTEENSTEEESSSVEESSSTEEESSSVEESSSTEEESSSVEESSSTEESSTEEESSSVEESSTEDDEKIQFNVFVENQIYTGSALKPSVSVYVDDVLLKAGKDYKVTYHNNTSADQENLTGGTGSSKDDTAKGFSDKLPYVIIEGKGNYEGQIYQNFHISQAELADENGNLAKGFTLRYTEQFAAANKVQKPFGSLRYKNAMKAGTDYDVKLERLTDSDGKNQKEIIGETVETSVIPAGDKGTFLLTINGKGNYSGEIQKYIYVADRDKLLKNANIVLGKNLKNIPFTGEDIVLNPSETGGDDVFIVKLGKQTLIPGRDYEIDEACKRYRNVGTAVLTIRGKGEYTGIKSVAFKITGTQFTEKNVSVANLKTSVTYTGLPIKQKNIALTPAGTQPSGKKKLVEDSDYTVSYKNNIKKGTATIIFTAKPESGYSGSFKKTFKIEQADISKVKLGSAVRNNILRETICYSKEGVKPADRLSPVNAQGIPLVLGTDYTVNYSDNTKTGTATMILKGKGSYTGSVAVDFKIGKAPLNDNPNLTKTCTPMVYSKNKVEYKPQFKIMDGKKVLSAKADYMISEYKNCSQAEVEAYLDALKNNAADTVLETMRPCAVITAAADGNYTGKTTVELVIYETKLSKNKLAITPENGTDIYNGSQVRPNVTVEYNGTKLIQGRDYEITAYGANNTAGKKKGSLTITGKGIYGGSVTVKFDIRSRNVNIANTKGLASASPFAENNNRLYTCQVMLGTT